MNKCVLVIAKTTVSLHAGGICFRQQKQALTFRPIDNNLACSNRSDGGKMKEQKARAIGICITNLYSFSH